MRTRARDGSCDTICINDLEVFYQVGVTDEERGKPQRLLLNLEMEHDFSAAVSDDGARVPSTRVPSRSHTTMSSAVSPS